MNKFERNTRYADAIYLLDTLIYDGLTKEESQLVIEARDKLIESQMIYLSRNQTPKTKVSSEKDCSQCETTCDDCDKNHDNNTETKNDEAINAETLVSAAKDMENLVKKVKEELSKGIAIFLDQ